MNRRPIDLALLLSVIDLPPRVARRDVDEPTEVLIEPPRPEPPRALERRPLPPPPTRQRRKVMRDASRHRRRDERARRS